MKGEKKGPVLIITKEFLTLYRTLCKYQTSRLNYNVRHMILYRPLLEQYSGEET